VPPAAETRLVRCTRGAVYDVIVDLRPESPTFTEHFAVVLTADNRKMLHIPLGLAHGFQTLEDSTEVLYQMSESHSPQHTRGVRWNDPIFGIAWPDDDVIILPREQDYPDFRPNLRLPR
jgi:dTDP-4-dehydrorhamnose 3,5-epimerase